MDMYEKNSFSWLSKQMAITSQVDQHLVNTSTSDNHLVNQNGSTNNSPMNHLNVVTTSHCLPITTTNAELTSSFHNNDARVLSNNNAVKLNSSVSKSF